MNLYEEINITAKKYESYTAEHLSKLIRIKSLSGREENVVLEIKSMMEKAGFDDVLIDGLGNVIGRIGNGKRIVAIDGHVDTVDVGNIDNWDFDPLSGEIKDGFVQGRGSVDQKGGVAAFITAGRIIKELGLCEDLTVYFTGSIMEEDCDGLCWKYILEEEGLKPECVIVTEPTNLRILRGQRGRMEMRVKFHGVSSHGSAPERGVNAIYMASRVALEIEKLNTVLKDDPFLGKGTITVTEIKSETPSLCAVSDFAQIHIDRRLTHGEDERVALDQINEIIKSKSEKAEVETLYFEETTFTGKKYGMRKYYPTWVVDDQHEIIKKGVAVYKELFNAQPLIDKWIFSTNGIAINGLHNIPVIGFGPGDETYAHAPNEKVPVDHLVRASAFYAAYFANY
ncbi:MAG: YgeY family selenium metabolism-linked hydrolase [Melioribacteraceae bacterium]|nr:YgeY family selenium metabolism-linked hydrolase [Melioribacteraceae bacterium]